MNNINELSQINPGLKILSFEKSGVPVQVRPGAPISEIIKEFSKSSNTFVCLKKSQKECSDELGDATMTPLRRIHSSTCNIENLNPGGFMDFIEITIKDFSGYIKRRDIQSPTWFAVEHNLLLHPDFFKVSGDEIKAFLWIMGVAAHLNQSKIRVYFDVCASQVKITSEAVKSCLEKLNGKRWDVTTPSRKRNGRVRVFTDNSGPACPTVQYSTGENSTKQYKTKQNSEDENSSNSKPQAFIAGYCERFKAKYGNNPEIIGKDAGIAVRVVKGWGSEKIELYLDAFFSLPDAWLVKAKHPLSAFETKLNEIVVFAKSGKFTTMKQAQQADSSAALANQIQQIRNGELR